MTVRFSNRGLLDLGALTTMGVSVKETSSPIGYFGTGLKFAVATLLRTGHEVTIWVGETRHELTSASSTIRGQEFQIVHLDGQPLGYTTQLGRNWEPWQAYRELACNARDEEDHRVGTDDDSPAPDRTLIEVTGEGIEAAHRARSRIFCESPVIAVRDLVAEVREGRSEHVYYRGIRIAKLEKPSLHTWNILESMELTEDRTLAHPYLVPYVCGRLVGTSSDEELITRVVRADEDTMEAGLEYGHVAEPSPAFMTVMGRLHRLPGVSHSALKLFRSRGGAQEVPEPAPLDRHEETMLEEATRLCLVIDPDFDVGEDMLVVASLGQGVLGMCRGGRVYIARQALTMGLETLAGTLYEEYLHRRWNYQDCTRALQNHLINQLTRMAVRAQP